VRATPPARASEPPARSRSGRAAPPANPARHWVQLAHAGAQSVLPREFAEARAEAPALLGSRSAYVALTNRVHRLLVGPFDTPAAARAFVGQLERRHVEAIAWTSPAGQEIERLRIANEPRAARNQPATEQRTAVRGGRGRSDGAAPTSNGRTASRTQRSRAEPEREPRSSRSRSREEPRAATRGRRSG
ncbi:MAG TPA: SPOR domain-containing protein, partial [Allosphingosinicella sp.]|nr:SPOR domain-containing protein [Allosphingosinicella sp.]